MSSGGRAGLPLSMRKRPLVHLELHTADMPRAFGFYAELCNWRADRVDTPCGTYWGLDTGGQVTGGIVESTAATRPLWLPYVDVPDIANATSRAEELGASVLLTPREGPTGWRSVVSAPAGGQVALWQRK